MAPNVFIHVRVSMDTLKEWSSIIIIRSVTDEHNWIGITCPLELLLNKKMPCVDNLSVCLVIHASDLQDL